MSKKEIKPTERQRLEEILGEAVSRETFETLNIYKKALIKWNSSINLVSPGTLEDIWCRHFIDSAQLFPLLPENFQVAFDFGSGAGFPGMVLSALVKEKRNGQVFLFESDQRKCLFLRSVSRETNITARVINKRIESIDRGLVPVPGVITARALAALDKLLSYSLPWAKENPDLVLLFLKGQRADQEIEAAQKTYDFDITILPSCTSSEGNILKIERLKGRY